MQGEGDAKALLFLSLLGLPTGPKVVPFWDYLIEF